MKKIARFRFSDEEDIVLADHQPPPNDLQVVSCGRRITLPSIQESHHDHGGQTSSNRTIDGDDVDTTSRNSDLPPVVYNPTPLRWYRPPEADFNGVDDQNQVDDAPAVSRNPCDDHVGTPSNYVSRNSEIPPVKKCTNNPTPLRWFRPDFYDGVEDDEVDTTLSLRPPGSTNYVSRNPNIPTVKNPTPLRWFRPDFFNGVEDDEVDTTLSLRPPGSTNHNKSRKQAKGKRRADSDVEDRQKKRRSKRSNKGDDEDQRPLIPIDKIPGLFKAIQSRNGSRPIFLYRKKLEESDVRRDQNRLFVTRRERMMGFLREEEAASVDGGGGGLKIVGVDGGGNVYDKLGLRKWASLKMTVINSVWWKAVAANNAKKGDVVEIWGYRENEKPCLAFNFRRENGGDSAGSSGTSSSDEGTSQV